MEKSDYLKRDQRVTVTILGPDNSTLYQSADEGYHSIEEAIEKSLANAALTINPEDCVFEVSNLNTGVAHKYRINAHGNLKLIV